MMDGGTITLIIGIISCIIGVSTFVSGMVTRAKTEGQTVEKINQCIKGIDEIKNDLKEQTNGFNTLQGKVIEHDSRIRAVEEDIKTLFSRVEKEA